MNKYLRLMRFDKPAGIALLWAPTAWALWLANQGHPNLSLFILFFVGTVCMRAAGCIINDMADRHIDKHVHRTRLRPITAGEITIFQAGLVLLVLLLLAGGVVLFLPRLCWYEALAAMGITILYPFAKRFFKAPQFLLGIAFSMGIPMAYAASQHTPNSMMFLLFAVNFIWIVAYDTMYALVDREDDLKIGVRSTAILFGAQAIPIILGCLGLIHLAWLVWIWLYPVTNWFALSWMVGLGIVIYQSYLLRQDSTEQAMRAFLWSGWYGLVLWVGLF